MNWLNNIDTGAVVDSVSSAASNTSFWDTGINYATKAFDWLDTATGWVEDNPNTAKLLAGVAGGAAQYYSARDQRKHEESIWERERQAMQIAPGKGGGNLGVNANGITKGLITNGLISNRDERR